MSNMYTIPKLQINGKSINYVKQTKVLGLIIDEDLNFHQHAIQKLKECNKKWGHITQHTNRKHGLNVRSLTLLLKTMILTKVHYAAPLWLHTNLHTYKDFWNSAIMKITGAMLNPSREITEVSLQLPPLDIQLEILTVKFLCKCLTADDIMTSIILQAEGSLGKCFHEQFRAVKSFLSWRTNYKNPARKIELIDSNNRSLALYTKEMMTEYQHVIWMKQIRNRTISSKASSDHDEVLLEVANNILVTKSILSKENSLFNFNTTKEEDSFLLDFIHGNSLIFGNRRKTMLGDDMLALCFFCITSQ